MDLTQRHLLEKTLRRLHAGFKTFQLYPPTHASARITVQDVTATLRAYLQRYGAIAVQVSKDKLLTDGASLTEGGMTALAFFFYIRNLVSVAILPGVTDDEVAAFLRILSLDRQGLESSGGVERLATHEDLPHIVVKAMALRETVDALSEAGIVDALTRVRRLSLDQREVVFNVLRNGPTATAAVLMSVYNAMPPATENAPPEVEHLLIALETLDRAIQDEPTEDQEALIQSLAQGVLQLDERIRAALAPELLSQTVGGGSGRTILTELTGQEIALLMMGPVAHGELAARLSKFLADLRLPEDKAAAVTAFLQVALAAEATKVGPFMTAPQTPQTLQEGVDREVWSAADPSLITFGPADQTGLEQVRHEISDVAVTRDAIKGLINLLRLQEQPEEIAETAKTLMGHLEFLVDRQDSDFLVLALQLLQEARSRAEAQRTTIDADLTRVLQGGVLDRLVHYALQPQANLPENVLPGLMAIREKVVPHLVRLLERETEPGQRSRLVKLLTDLSAGHADLIGSHLAGASWQLTRNLAFVLGELRDPVAVGQLARLAAHPEYRVRREVIDALRKISTDQARRALLEFLRDRDPRIQYALIEGADAQYDSRIVDWLQHIIRSPDRTQAGIAAKVAAMNALARMRAGEALPLLRRIARGRWVFGQGRRTVRDTARQILDRWERSNQQPA